MKQCHQIEDEFKFYAIFDTNTLEKRKKIAELLERSIIISNNREADIQQDNTVVIKTMDTEKIEPKPAKIPRVSSIAFTSHCQSTRCTNISSADTNINHPQIPSIISKALQSSDVNATIKLPIIANDIQINQEKKNSNSTCIGQKRVQQKEKKTSEKKISETATKGGYNDVNIEHLFEEMDPKQNATDEEQSQGDSTSSKEELPKISKGIPQYDLEHLPTFFATKPSSKLGLALHKAESEGRDHICKTRASSVHNEDKSGGIALEELMKHQIEVANKREKLERDQYYHISKDFERRLKERDIQLKDKPPTLE